VGISTGSLNTLSLEDCFGLASEAGFDGVEVLCDRRPEARDAHCLGTLSSRWRLPIWSLHAPFPEWVSRHWRVGAVASIEQTVRLAEAIGAAHVVMHVPRRVRLLRATIGPLSLRVPWWASYDRAVRRWIQSGGLRELQARTAVQVCVENLPPLTRWPILRCLTKWNTLADWPLVHDHLTLDTTHWATWGVLPLAAYRAGGAKVRHIHVSNYQRGRQHRLPQRGNLDLRAFLHGLAADAFGGQIVLELCPESLEASQPELLRRNLAESLAFCRGAFRSGA